MCTILDVVMTSKAEVHEHKFLPVISLLLVYTHFICLCKKKQLIFTLFSLTTFTALLVWLICCYVNEDKNLVNKRGSLTEVVDDGETLTDFI